MWILTRAGARARPDTGQASVELVALLPAFGLIVALAFQALLAGETWWLATVAAREGARASALGGDPVRAARTAVPGRFGGRAVVSSSAPGVTVTLPIPALVPGVRIGSAVGRARMEPQR